MNTPEPPRECWERRKLGIELRQKYELYFVALAFTLAGLSVQSAQKSGQCWDNLVEIGGWMALPAVILLGARYNRYRKDGSMFLNELFISPVKDSGGEVTHFVGIQHLRFGDVTPGKNL